MFTIRQPEHGSLVVDGISSEALRGRASVWAYLPPGYDEEPDRRYPVLYLLHGAWGWEWDWAMKGNVGGTLGRLIDSGALEPLIVVMPNDGLKREGTFYVNWADGSGRYEDWIARDLVGYVDANLRTKTTREDRCISGLSMGGFGAFHVGLRNRNLYRSVASHSGLFSVASEGGFWDQFRDQAFGSMEKARAASPLHFVAEIPKAELPALYHDCGTEDFLFGANQEMHARLEELGIPSTYRTFSGAHTWEYWTEHLVDSLAFHYPKA